MKKVQVFRTWDNGKQTLGILTITDETGIIFTARTLELPYKDNANSISSFNPGKYICKFTLSPSFKIKTYEITSVPGRAGVRIHSANYVSQLRGCIALGDAHKDINADKLSDVTHSGKSIAEFEKLMEYKDFELEIVKAY